MFLWFAGLALVIVWQVFQSPALDHRLVMLGAVLPVSELVLGRPGVLHTLLGAVVLLAVVMLATRNRRRLRRRALGIPIGLFIHLALDGVWTDARLFWWPCFGSTFGSSRLPEVSRGLWALPMELVGAVALVVCWQRFGLSDSARRRSFLRTGRVDRQLAR